jgi:hypothetical protein
MSNPLTPGADRKRKDCPTTSSKRSRLTGSSSRLPSSDPPPRNNPTSQPGREIIRNFHTPGENFAADEALAAASSGHLARHLEQHVLASADVASARGAYTDALRVRDSPPPRLFYPNPSKPQSKPSPHCTESENQQ